VQGWSQPPRRVEQNANAKHDPDWRDKNLPSQRDAACASRPTGGTTMPPGATRSRSSGRVRVRSGRGRRQHHVSTARWHVLLWQGYLRIMNPAGGNRADRLAMAGTPGMAPCTRWRIRARCCQPGQPSGDLVTGRAGCATTSTAHAGRQSQRERLAIGAASRGSWRQGYSGHHAGRDGELAGSTRTGGQRSGRARRLADRLVRRHAGGRREQSRLTCEPGSR